MTSFKFKQFTLSDKNSSMKITTDAVLLGAWTNSRNSETILDIGCGCGIIALMLAQKSNAIIHGIDIHQDSVNEAKQNALNSPWSKRINFKTISFQEYWKSCNLKYDLIVSNPPFFMNSLKSSDKRRSAARHTDSLTYEEIIVGVKNILKENGRLCVVLPIRESDFFKEKALIESLYCTKILNVKNNSKSIVKRVLIQFELTKKQIQTDVLTIRKDNNDFSDEYRTLTKDFHTNIL